MTGPIATNRTSGISLSGLGGARRKGGPASKAMADVAGSVASNIAHELGLAVDPDRNRRGNAQDIYGIEEAADTLVSGFSGSPADRGRAAQALHAFAQEVASLVAARPGSRALGQIDHSLAAIFQKEPAQSAQGLAGALGLIEDATRNLAEL